MASITSLLKKAQGNEDQPLDRTLRPYSLIGEPYIHDYVGLHHQGEPELYLALGLRPEIFGVERHLSDGGESLEDELERRTAELMHMIAPRIGIGRRAKLTPNADIIRWVLMNDPDSTVTLYGVEPVKPGAYIPKEEADRIVPHLYGPRFRELIFPLIHPGVRAVRVIMSDMGNHISRLIMDENLTHEMRMMLEKRIREDMEKLNALIKSDPTIWQYMSKIDRVGYHAFQHAIRYGMIPHWPEADFGLAGPHPPLGRRVERRESEADRFFAPLIQSPRPIKPYYPDLQ